MDSSLGDYVCRCYGCDEEMKAKDWLLHHENCKEIKKYLVYKQGFKEETNKTNCNGCLRFLNMTSVQKYLKGEERRCCVCDKVYCFHCSKLTFVESKPICFICADDPKSSSFPSHFIYQNNVKIKVTRQWKRATQLISYLGKQSKQ